MPTDCEPWPGNTNANAIRTLRPSEKRRRDYSGSRFAASGPPRPARHRGRRTDGRPPPPARHCREGQRPGALLVSSLPHDEAARESSRRARRRRRCASVPAAMKPCSTPEAPTYHCSCGSRNHRPASMASDRGRRRSMQPLARAVVAGEQGPQQHEAQQVEQRVPQVEVHQMSGQEPPPLPGRDGLALVAQRQRAPSPRRAQATATAGMPRQSRVSP